MTRSPEKRRRRLVVAPLLALALAACATEGWTVVQPTDTVGTYNLGILNYTASRGGMLTRVVGNPFDGPKDEFDRAVVGIAANSHFGQHQPFFTEPPEGYSSPYKVVFLFNPARNASTLALCRDPNQPRGEQKPGQLRLTAVFCLGEKRLTSTTGYVSGAKNPKDRAFRDLVSQVSLALFPALKPDERDCDRRIFPCR
jgi:hypothetical protein